MPERLDDPRITALSDLSNRYDVVLCDVWGVLHNGVTAFSEASEALMAARRRGVTVVFLTNSPRPNPGVLTQLRGLACRMRPMTASSLPAT